MPRRFSTLVMSLMLYLLAGHVVAVDSPYFAYVSGNSNNIECYRFTPTATTKATMLVSTSTTNVGSSSGYMAWSPDRAHMYTLRTGNLIAAYNINSSTGALTHIGTDRSSGGTGVTHLCVHPSGDWVYTANYSSGHVGAIPVNADGTLGVPLTPVLAGVKAHMVLTNRAGTRLYVPCLGSDHVAIYQIDQTTGALTANTPATVALPAGVGPRHMDFNSDESRAYVINELGSTMTAFSHNTATGALTSPQHITTLPGSLTANTNRTCAHVLVSNDDQTLYGSNRGATGADPNDIVSFRIAPSTGTMTLLAHETGGGEISHPRDFTLDPTGTVLLVASRDADLLTLFRVTPSTGVITRIDALTVGDGPTFVGVMPKQNAAPTVATAAAVAPSPVVGTSATVSVLGADDFGESALTYTWSTVGSPPAAVTFSASGTNAAKSATVTFTKAGSYQVRATITDAEGATVTSTVSFTVSQTVTTITLSPTSASVVSGATQGFTASAKDQFGTALVTPPTFVWTTTGGGTITSAGLFSATTVGGPFTVTATVGTKNGTASVTVAAGGGGGGGSGGGGGGGGCGLGGGLATGLLAMMFLLRPVFLRRPGSRSSRRMKTVG